MRCPKCGATFEEGARECPNCGKPFVDRFAEILDSEIGLKRAVKILSFIMILAFASATLILLIIGLPHFDGKDGLGWLSIGLCLLFLTDILFCLTLYFHNKANNVLSSKGHIAFCLISGILGCFPVSIPFLIRGIRIRKKLDLDE